MSKTLRDYVQFKCRGRNYFTNRAANKLFKAIKAECKVDDDDDEMLGTFVMVYSCTDGVTFDFDGREREPLTLFKSQWETLGGSPKPKKLWEIRTSMPDSLYNEWCGYFNEGQDLFDVPDEQKSLDRLTPELREEAQKPNSPSQEPIEFGRSA